MFRKRLFVVLVLCGLQFATAQRWDPQDSIKTVDKNQDRINDFRDNIIDWTEISYDHELVTVSHNAL